MWTNLVVSFCFVLSSVVGTFVYQAWAIRTTGSFGTDAARMENVIDARPCLVWWALGELGNRAIEAGDDAVERGDFRQAIDCYGYLLADRRKDHPEPTGFEACARQRLGSLPWADWRYAKQLLKQNQHVQAREVLEEFRTLFPNAPPGLVEQVEKARTKSWIDEILHLRSHGRYETALARIRDLESSGAPSDVIALAHGSIFRKTLWGWVSSLVRRHRVGPAYDAVDEALDMFPGNTGIERNRKDLYGWIAREVFHVDLVTRPSSTLVPPDLAAGAVPRGQTQLSMENLGTGTAVVSLASVDRFDDPQKIRVKPTNTGTLVLAPGSYWQMQVRFVGKRIEGQLGQFELREGQYKQTVGI